MAKTPEPTVEKKSFTISEASAELGMPVKEVERLISEGKLAYTTVDGVIMIEEDAIRDFQDAFRNIPGGSL